MGSPLDGVLGSDGDDRSLAWRVREWLDKRRRGSAGRAARQAVGDEIDRAERRIRDSLDDEIDRLHLDLRYVHRTRDDEMILVPVLTLVLDADSSRLDGDRAWRLVGSSVAPLHSALEDQFVRQYDIRFKIGRGGAASFQYVLLTPDLVKQFVSDPGADYRDLRDSVEREDDGDDVIAPVSLTSRPDINFGIVTSRDIKWLLRAHKKA